MSREHAEHIRAWIARWEAATPDARRAELARLDANGYADARVEAAQHGFSNFGVASPEEIPAALAVAEPPKEAIASFEAPPPPLVAYTDGSGTIATKPCGAGVVVKLPDGRRLEAYKALGMGTNNVGELTAVELALDLLDKAGHPREAPTWIFTDSQYALGVLAKGWKAQANVPLINRVRPRLSHRKAQLTWLAGHVGIVENERADELANQGVTESKR